MTKIQFTPEAIAMSDAINVWKIELENSRAHNKSLSIELHDLKHAIREAMVLIEAEKFDLSKGASMPEVLFTKCAQRDLDILKQCCGGFL